MSMPHARGTPPVEQGVEQAQDIELREWLDSLDFVLQERGRERAEEILGCLREHASERAGIRVVEKRDEGLELFCFLAEITRGPNHGFKFGEGRLAHCTNAKQASSAQVDKGFFNVVPVGVLREVGADNHLKTRSGRPPVLWAVAGEKSGVVGGEL